MKKIFYILPFLLLACYKKELKVKEGYINLYPFFKNAVINKNSKTVSLHNFDQTREGLEYLLNVNGSLSESRMWKDGKLNGLVISYSNNGKLKKVRNYVDDTLCGNYFVLDSLKGEIIEYREIIKSSSGGTVDNQFIKFKNKKIDIENSTFLVIKKQLKDVYKIVLFSRHKFPYYSVQYIESCSSAYNFKAIDEAKVIDLGNDNIFQVKFKDNKHRCVMGYFLNYRYPYAKEIEEGEYEKGEKFGLITYFKFIDNN